jgi:hypothetical protein
MTRIKAIKEKGIPEVNVENTFALTVDTSLPEETLLVHSLGNNCICDTDARGHATPKMLSKLELVLDASEGFIPLWSKNTLLKWRFQDRSLSVFNNPETVKSKVRNLFGEALLKWGDSAPVKFKEDNDLWDFEIAVRNVDQCSVYGCVLASAFFPDAGKHEFVVYPKIFTQSKEEQIDTFIHEIGHIFGLRHFFAQLSEQQWPSEIYGTHNKFSIMNYGVLSKLTDVDKSDLKALYLAVWSGALKGINGTPIKLVKPYSASVNLPDGQIAFEQLR